MSELAEWVERTLVGAVVLVAGLLTWVWRDFDRRMLELERVDAEAKISEMARRFDRFESEAREQRADVKAELRRVNDKLDTQQAQVLARIDQHHATVVASFAALVRSRPSEHHD